jgi:hypothetical protein
MTSDEKQGSLLDQIHGPNEARFDGETYEHVTDSKRLGKQLQKVLVALTPEWQTLLELEATTGIQPQSISARLRDLRKEKFGAYPVETRRSPSGGGTFQYRLAGRKGEGTPQRKRLTTAAVDAIQAADKLASFIEHQSACGSRRGFQCDCGLVVALDNYIRARGDVPQA